MQITKEFRIQTEENNSKEIMHEKGNNLKYPKGDKRVYYICEIRIKYLEKEHLRNKTECLDIKDLGY